MLFVIVMAKDAFQYVVLEPKPLLAGQSSRESRNNTPECGSGLCRCGCLQRTPSPLPQGAGHRVSAFLAFLGREFSLDEGKAGDQKIPACSCANSFFWQDGHPPANAECPLWGSGAQSLLTVRVGKTQADVRMCGMLGPK